MTDTINDSQFMLANVLVLPSHNRLDLHDKSIKLQPKAMAVLNYLACNHQRVISSQELMEKLWAGRVVTQGSVQKSINALRSAFTELIGEQEVIVHYSKRGYQITIPPQFLEATEAPITSISPTSIRPQKKLTKPSIFLWAIPIILIVILASIYFSRTQNSIAPVVKQHKTSFTVTEGYTLETGHERNATPHPDNEHLAYVREIFVSDAEGETQSEIIIRNKEGKDWHLSKSLGSWYKLAWSPSGNQLVAVEVKSQDGPPRRPNFYDKANYLYSFHVFTLDLVNNRLLEKQLLSQWHGRIYSVTWWDEQNLEIVAKQGSSGNNTRYRYSTVNQQLTQLEELDGAAIPIASAVLNHKTAVASSRQNSTQIDLLNESQKSIGHWKFDSQGLDWSWIPDGSGLLIFSEDEQKLFNFYWDGQEVQIPFTVANDKIISRPRYSADGKAIYYTEEQRSSNIFQVNLAGEKKSLTQNINLNYAATYSNAGDKVVYASVRNNQIHLWLVEGNQERRLSADAIPKKVGNIVWSTDDQSVIFNAANNLYLTNLSDSKTQLLLSEKIKIEPLAYFPDKSLAYLIKNSGDVRSIWRFDLKTQTQKQLTFGAVGSAMAFDGDIYFQYVGETGLWVLRNSNQALEQISTELKANNKLLKVDAKGIYYISGGACNESDVYYSSFASSETTTLLARPSKLVSTSSFHPQKGVLQTECYLPEANIVMMK